MPCPCTLVLEKARTVCCSTCPKSGFRKLLKTVLLPLNFSSGSLSDKDRCKILSEDTIQIFVCPPRVAQQSNCALVEFREGCRTHVQTFPRRGLHIHGVCGTHDGCCSSYKTCLPAPLSASCVHKQPSYLCALHLNHALTCSPYQMGRSFLDSGLLGKANDPSHSRRRQ